LGVPAMLKIVAKPFRVQWTSPLAMAGDSILQFPRRGAGPESAYHRDRVDGPVRSVGNATPAPDTEFKLGRIPPPG